MVDHYSQLLHCIDDSVGCGSDIGGKRFTAEYMKSGLYANDLLTSILCYVIYSKMLTLNSLEYPPKNGLVFPSLNKSFPGKLWAELCLLLAEANRKCLE